VTRLLTAALVCGLVVAAAAPAHAQLTEKDIDRIRTALDRPAALKLTPAERPPDFRVYIEEKNPLQDLFDIPAWMPEKPGWRPPALGFDLLSIVRSVAHEVADAKRGHDVRVAHEEVLREIASYCAAQPNSGAGIAICASAPAIR
jgi:hypothetical protein